MQSRTTMYLYKQLDVYACGSKVCKYMDTICGYIFCAGGGQGREVNTRDRVENAWDGDVFLFLNVSFLQYEFLQVGKLYKELHTTIPYNTPKWKGV